MANTIRANLELMPSNTVKNVERLDAKVLSSEADKFISSNLLGYYVLINTWLMLIKQWSQHGWIFVSDYLQKYGLIDFIRNMDSAATDLINGVPIGFSLARTLWDDIRDSAPIVGTPHDAETTSHSNPLSAMLLICRYGKRFSPLNADLLRKSSLDDFVSRQKELKQSQRQPHSRFIVAEVREAISGLLDWNRLTRELESVDISDIEFTPGVSFDTKADLVSKLKRVAEERVEYFPLPFGIPLVAQGWDSKPCEYWGKRNDIEVHCVRLSPVPKNYKTARVIAPEDVVRQALARRYFTISDRYLPEMIKLHDQSQNESLAKFGSSSGYVSTIDLHAASDSLTITLLFELLPSKFVKVLQRVLPTHYKYDGKRYIMQSCATMGNSMTFWLESVVFAGITLAAVRCYNRFSDMRVCERVISVYGDDIIAPTDATPTVIEWLEMLGFVVNEDKSFFSKELLYRESCGVEYLNGVDLTSRYFPRFPLVGKLGGAMSNKYIRDSFTDTKVDTMSSLVDLQHKLYGICLPASMLVREVIREADPRMTTSTPDEMLHDIWSYVSEPVIIPAPAGAFDEKGALRRIVVEGMVREGHSCPAYVIPGNLYIKNPEDYDHWGFELYKLYCYQQFLKYGPRFATPLDELLGVSDPPLSFEEALGFGEVKWVLVK
jgi:hypothetical protein